MIQKKPAIFSRRSLTLLSLYLIPILGVCGFVSFFSVNVPRFDQWILPYWFEKFSTGDLTLKNLFAQHNSHRLFFPKLIFIGLSFASNWNIKWELYFNIFIAILTFLALHYLSQRTAQKLTQTSLNLANLSSSILLFSWVQHENWLWGFQIAIFLINLCVILSCLVLSTQSFKPQTRLTIAAFLCGIASFSSAQGLLSWLGMIPTVWTVEGSYKQKKHRLLVWIFLFIFSSLIYSINYRQETDTVPTVSDNKLFATIHFFLNLIAVPFLDSNEWNWLLGGIIILIFLSLIYSAITSDHKLDLNPNLSPWISISLFSLLCSLLIAVGRSGLGADYAILASRYTTHTILLPIAIIQLSQRIFLNNLNHSIIVYRDNKLFIFGFLTGILIGLNLVLSANSAFYVQSRLPLIQGGKTCFHLINYLEQSAFLKTNPQSCLLHLHSASWVKVIWDSAEHLKRLKFREFAQNVAFISYPKQNYGEITSPLDSEQIFSSSTAKSVKLEGWIQRSLSSNPSNLILFSLAQKQSFFANAYALELTSQPLNSNPSSSEHRLKWEVELSADVLPFGNSIIHAWIYDPIDNQFLKLKNLVSITRFDSPPSEQ